MSKRTREFIKDNHQEHFLKSLNNSLTDFEQQFYRESHPLPECIFIIGPQRSGSTYLSQILISNYLLWYPTNQIAKFWMAPVSGTILNPINVPNDSELFKSELGYTKGDQGPHEFGYFWRRWFPNKFEPNVKIDQDELKRVLKGIGFVSKSPLLFKNLIYGTNYCEEIFNTLGNKVRFIRMSRSEGDVIDSTYRSRIKLFDDDKSWFGIKPDNYDAIKTISNPHLQIKNQIQAIENQLDLFEKKCPPKQILNINFETLKTNPEIILKQIESKFGNILHLRSTKK